MRLRRHASRLVGVPLSYVIGHALRWSGTRVGMALVYHGIADPQGDPARELVPAYGTRTFELQLRHLKACYRVVEASKLLEAVTERRRGQRFPVSITFDDDLRSHVDTAMPILQRVGVPATFFLCGASLARPYGFWWERLQKAMDRGLPLESFLPGREALPVGAALADNPGAIHELGAAIERLPVEERLDVARRLESLLGPDRDQGGMPVEHVRALARAGFEIGFHTLRHDALPRLDDAQLEGALKEGRADVASLAGRELDTIGYPHGKADARVARAARESGYRFGFTTDGDVVTPASDPLLLGRIYPAFASTVGFALQLARSLTRAAAAGHAARTRAPEPAGAGLEGGGR